MERQTHTQGKCSITGVCAHPSLWVQCSKCQCDYFHVCICVTNFCKNTFSCVIKRECTLCLFGMRQQFIALNRTPWWCSTSSRKNREKGGRQAGSLSLMGTSPRAVPMPAPGLITRDGKKGETWGKADGAERDRRVLWRWGTPRHSAVTGHSHTALFHFSFFSSCFFQINSHHLMNYAQQFNTKSIVKWLAPSSWRISLYSKFHFLCLVSSVLLSLVSDCLNTASVGINHVSLIGFLHVA